MPRDKLGSPGSSLAQERTRFGDEKAERRDGDYEKVELVEALDGEFRVAFACVRSAALLAIEGNDRLEVEKNDRSRILGNPCGRQGKLGRLRQREDQAACPGLFRDRPL